MLLLSLILISYYNNLFLMVVWNSMLLKIIIIPLGVVKQHVRFI
jgi:hypothetical protein